VRVNATGEMIFLCEECDAVWLSADAVGQSPWLDFGSYMSRFGLKGLWAEVTMLDDGSGLA